MSGEQAGKQQKHYHIVHQSLVLDATIGGVKSTWTRYLAMFGMVLFPFTGGSLIGILALAGGLVLFNGAVLRKVYETDRLLPELLFGVVLEQPEFFQATRDVNDSRSSDTRSIPDPKLP